MGGETMTLEDIIQADLEIIIYLQHKTEFLVFFYLSSLGFSAAYWSYCFGLVATVFLL
jgi:hypothetical protein